MPGVGHSSRERRNSKTVPGEESSITVNSVCVDPTGDRDTLVTRLHVSLCRAPAGHCRG